MKKNNITLIGINFYPEDSSTGLYSTQMMEYLAKSYNVDVITGFPYYPEWEIREEYKNKKRFLVEKKDDITIYRYKQYVPKNPNFKTRTLHLLDFTFGSIRNILKITKTDLVIVVVPFTSTILLGKILALLKGAKLWVHIQDFEVDAILDSGISHNQTGIKKRLFQFLFWIEKKLLNSSDLASTISYGMISKLKTKTNTPCYFFPNWVDETFIDPTKAKQHELMKSSKFKILYSGNIGAKQDWNFFIKVAEYFKGNEEIEFIVVGAGAKKEWLVTQTQAYTNVIHHMPVEYDTLPDLLCNTDLHILFQKNDVIDSVMPSKLLGMMASAKASIVTGNLESEVAKVFEKSKGGYFYDSECFYDVVNAITELSSDKTKAKEMGVNARTYIVEHFSASKVLANFKSKVQEVIDA
jgi:colanic acid biosynthesis glycosyl transferase WcaI